MSAGTAIPSVAEALARGVGVLGARAGLRPIHQLAGVAESPPLGAAIVVSDEMPLRQALAMWSKARAQRDHTGLSPIVVAAGFGELAVHGWLGPERNDDLATTLAAFEQESADGFFGARARDDGDMAARVEAALDALGARAGCDPMSILHRLPIDDLEAIESGGDGDGDGDGGDGINFAEPPLPDDVRAAHAQLLVEREAALELARRTPGPRLLWQQTARSFDEATAVAEITGGPARLALVAAPPALTLLHLGFGGFNDCPAPHQHARVWEHWQRAVGAEPVLLDDDRMEGIIAHPIDTRAALVSFTSEVAAYDANTLSAGVLSLAGRLYRNAGVRFWWD